MVPGTFGIPVPVEIKEGGDVIEGDEGETDQRITLEEEEEQTEPKFRGGPNRLHVSRKVTERYGPTGGCPACAAIVRQGHVLTDLGTTTMMHVELERCS